MLIYSSRTAKPLSQTLISYELIPVFILTILLASFGCSSNNPTGSGPVGPVAVTVSPASGPPLTSVTLSGVDSSTIDPANMYALVSGAPAPLFVADSGGAVKVTIPAIVDSATQWIDTSISAMSLVILNSQTGDTVAFGENIFTLETLPPSPGAATQMLSDWTTIATSWETIATALSGGPGVEDQIVSSALSGLDSLIFGSDSLSLKSLTTKLGSGNPQDLALLESLLGSSGVVEQ